ncbi:hypothetical protein CXK92_20665 [Stutzerimonas stutzeri]|uniref:Uncharacterized protein n=1 Tax=Stutzerimonas stutzeri TaxID=316 RepID=A0A2N8RWG6_STUST|nr:hypothetical protein CXK92_20665 [Stutzerimonas stutzeri]
MNESSCYRPRAIPAGKAGCLLEKPLKINRFGVTDSAAATSRRAGAVFGCLLSQPNVRQVLLSMIAPIAVHACVHTSRHRGGPINVRT